MEAYMQFEIKLKPSIFTSILPETVSIPRFPLFGKFEIDGVACTVTGLEYCRQEVAKDRDMPPGWIYQVDDGSNLTAMISEQELIGCLPVNQVEVVAIAA
jgi:hypothetical protein